MPKRKLVTTQDKQRRKTTTDFVGRQSQLRDFKLNLSLDPTSDGFQMLWNVFGQGGVGKSTLLKQFVRQAEAAGFALAQVDVEDPKMREVTAVLATIAEQFQSAGINLKDFLKRYEDYQQAKGKIAKDPDKPGGLAKDLVSGGLRTASKIGAEFVPGGGALLEALPFDKLTDKAGEWTSYLFKTLKSDDDVKLVQDPLAVLTPLLLTSLREAWEDGRNFAILLDTYETHAPELDDWLIRFLTGEYGLVPLFPFVTAGRDPLKSRDWRGLNLVRHLELNAFTQDETIDYLSQRKFTNSEEKEKIYTLTGGLPVFVEMLADAGPDGESNEGEAQDRVVGCFLWHIKDEALRTLALRASLVNSLNQDVVANLLEEADRPRAPELFAWLKRRPFVQRRVGDWTYHPIVRDVMRRHQRAISPATFTELHERMAGYFGRLRKAIQGKAEEMPFRDAAYRKHSEEHAFHLLWANYRGNLGEVMEMLADGVSFDVYIRPVIGHLRQVEEILLITSTWASCWEEASETPDNLCTLLKRLNESGWINNSKTAFYLLLSQGGLEADKATAISCYQKAAKISPDKHDAYYSLGIAYASQGVYAAAIACYQKAIEIKPDYHEAYYNMGIAYDKQGDNNAAIGCYKKAVEVKPDYYEAYNNMGIAYGKQGDNNAAIGCYKKAVEVKPDYHEAYYNMGTAFDNQSDYAAAIACYQKAIEIKPDYYETYNNMGIAFDNQSDYAAAIVRYQKAVEIKPDFHEAHNNIGNVYLKQYDYAAAIASFQKALAIKPDFHAAYNNMGIAYENQGDYAAAIASFQKALAIKPDDYKVYHSMGWTYLIQHHFEPAAAAFTKCWDLTEGQYNIAAMNLGHVKLLTGNLDAARTWYQTSLPLWENTADFYQGMAGDYDELRMSALGVEREAYEALWKPE